MYGSRTLPYLKALLEYRKGNYQACLSHLDSKIFNDIKNPTHRNLMDRLKNNPATWRVRTLAHAQLGHKTEALQSLENAKMSLIDRDDWTVSLMDYRLDEAITLLKEKGYLPKN